jgi:hypothetical protein
MSPLSSTMRLLMTDATDHKGKLKRVVQFVRLIGIESETISQGHLYLS